MPSSLFLVFPKQTDFFKFITWSLKEEILSYLSPRQYFYDAILKLNKSSPLFAEVHCLVLDNNEIGFDHLLSDALQNEPCLKNPDTLVLLLGSAGSISKDDIGKWFFIKQAHKVDTGLADFENKMIVRSKKVLKRVPCLGQSYTQLFAALKCKKGFSINFFNEAQLAEEFGDKGVYDVETYDFYTICEANNISNYAAVRLVVSKVSTVPFEEDYMFNLSEKVSGTPITYLNYICDCKEFDEVNIKHEKEKDSESSESKKSKKSSKLVISSEAMTHFKRYCRLKKNYEFKKILPIIKVTAATLSVPGVYDTHVSNALFPVTKILAKSYHKKMETALDKCSFVVDTSSNKKQTQKLAKKATKTWLHHVEGRINYSPSTKENSKKD